MKRLTFILFFFGTCLSLQGQITYLNIHFSDTNVKANKLVSYQKKVDINELKFQLQNITNQLHAQAYLTARFDSLITTKEGDFNAYYYLGKQFQWTYLKTKNIDEEVLSKIGFREKLFFNKPFKPNQLQNFYQKAISHYENHGYPFASIKLDNVTITDNQINALMTLDKNGFYKIDSLIVKGSSTIGDKYLHNYLRLKPGDIYDEQVVSQINTKLKEIPFVTEKTPYRVIFNEKSSKILLHLDKRKASRFNGVLGIQPNEETGKIRFTGDVKLNLINSFKKGEEIDFNWRSIQEQTQDLKAKFVYPFVMNSAFGLDLNFKLFKRDTTFIDVFSKIGVRYMLKGNNYITAFYQNKSSSLLSSKSLQTLTVLPSFADVSTQLYGLALNFNRLDYILNPKKGFELNFEGALGNKRIKKNVNINESLYDSLKLNSTLYQVNLNAAYYFSFAKRNVIKIGSQNGITENENLFENELFRIGGLKTLRGFDEESIYSSLYSINTLEYRFILEQNSYLFVFFDWTYYEKDLVNSYLSDRPYGYGAGMSFETRAGIFSISYALGKQFDNPVLLKNAKIHFGFVNYF